MKKILRGEAIWLVLFIALFLVGCAKEKRAPVPLVVKPSREKDFYEPNDSKSTAYDLSKSTTITAFISSPTDRDFYRILVSSGGVLTVEVKSIPSGCKYGVIVTVPNGRTYYLGSGGESKRSFDTKEMKIYGYFYLEVFSKRELAEVTAGIPGTFSTTSPYIIEVKVE